MTNAFQQDGEGDSRSHRQQSRLDGRLVALRVFSTVFGTCDVRLTDVEDQLTPVQIAEILIEGSPKAYIKTGGSGRKVLVAFCGDCGTALYSTKRDTESPLNLRIGAIKQRRELIPKMQGFCGSGMPWAMNIEGIHKVPESDRP